MSKDVMVGFRASREYRQELQRIALDRGIKVQGLVERALNDYLSRSDVKNEQQPNPVKDRLRILFDRVVAGITPDDRRLLEQLLQIIENNKGLAIAGKSTADSGVIAEPKGKTEAAGDAKESRERDTRKSRPA